MSRLEQHRWPVTLSHRGLVLRPLEPRDSRRWDDVRRRNWDWLRTWEATPPPARDSGPGSFTQLARMMRRQAKENRALPWVIEYDPSEGTARGASSGLIGQLTVSGITFGSARWAQIGYWIDEGFAGRGLVPLAVAMACDYCFETMNLHRIEIAIRPENIKSLRVVEKLGFREEGLRPAYLHIDGDWRDHLVFALNADEAADGLVHRWDTWADQRT